ncbi:ArsR/SmtB family transcription factor [Thiomicrorhabdus aquaedulcis]|uniref:ArsR/SmtB family transcription factor n=1 Tax=Thiomicrorhabdus aquaedulcis TaxID=2211106 RepID=UPI000FDBBBF3|nr:metalloregulator ArsR/SmtB family transcription factor [Thiomicrorhabdus aquaedulcis]
MDDLERDIQQEYEKDLEHYSQFFKALSEPLRIRLLHLLSQKESLCVCELVAVLKVGQSQVSRHLAYLKAANLVTAYRKGAWMHYQISPNALLGINELVFKRLCAQFAQTQADAEALQLKVQCEV